MRVFQVAGASASEKDKDVGAAEEDAAGDEEEKDAGASAGEA